nr:MAG TPA: hypothetical protein [Caudoviricetes sp.]
MNMRNKKLKSKTTADDGLYYKKLASKTYNVTHNVANNVKKRKRNK